jgi:hypothetical protein
MSSTVSSKPNATKSPSISTPQQRDPKLEARADEVAQQIVDNLKKLSKTKAGHK